MGAPKNRDLPEMNPLGRLAGRQQAPTFFYACGYTVLPNIYRYFVICVPPLLLSIRNCPGPWRGGTQACLLNKFIKIYSPANIVRFLMPNLPGNRELSSEQVLGNAMNFEVLDQYTQYWARPGPEEPLEEKKRSWPYFIRSFHGNRARPNSKKTVSCQPPASPQQLTQQPTSSQPASS